MWTENCTQLRLTSLRAWSEPSLLAMGNRLYIEQWSLWLDNKNAWTDRKHCCLHTSNILFLYAKIHFLSYLIEITVKCAFKGLTQYWQADFITAGTSEGRINHFPTIRSYLFSYTSWSGIYLMHDDLLFRNFPLADDLDGVLFRGNGIFAWNMRVDLVVCNR